MLIELKNSLCAVVFVHFRHSDPVTVINLIWLHHYEFTSYKAKLRSCD